MARWSTILLMLPAALAGCRADRSANELAQLDRELADTDATAPRDPALTAALRDQIVVDPALTQQSNANAVRPPSRPDPMQVPSTDVAAVAEKPAIPADLRPAPAPGGSADRIRAAQGALTLGALAERQPDRRAANCANRIRYSAAWANRLPAATPLYPDARVVEAAGTDEAGCALRVVSYVSRAAVGRLADFYHSRATAAGYSSGHEADGATHLVGGTRDDSAYVAYLRPRNGGGTDVDLIVD